MTRRFFSGKTLDQTVMMAARHYGIDPSELAYRQIEKKHGFLRTRKAVMIAVDPESPRRQPEEAVEAAPAPEMATEAEPRPAEPQRAEPVAEPTSSWSEPEAPAERLSEEAGVVDDSDDWRPVVDEAPVDVAPTQAPSPDEASVPEAPVEARAEEPAIAAPAGRREGPPAGDEEMLAAAEDAARRLMGFAGIDADAVAKWGDERVEVEVEGPDSSVLVVEGGKGLLAIQHLLPRMLRGLTGRSSFVRVDSQGFHQNRKERLEALAVKEAEAASRNGTPRTLPPMAPDERRIVHLAVQEIPTVETESRGTGLHKRVVIRPVTGDGGHDDIEARHGF